MIPAPRGMVAFYAHEGEGIGKYRTELPVVYIDDDGDPVVVTEDGRLWVARSLRNFAGLGFTEHPEIVSLIPAGGWRLEVTEDDGTVVWDCASRWLGTDE